MAVFALDKLIEQARHLAADYRNATGKSLPITGEIAKYDACQHLQLHANEQVGDGFDATGIEQPWQGWRIQIKGRAIFNEGKNTQRIGQLKLDKVWDALVLVVMNEAFMPVEMYIAERRDIEAELNQHPSRRRERGAMSVAKFKNIAQLVWTERDGRIRDDVWDNQLST